MSTAKEKGKAKVEPGNEVIHSSDGSSSDEHSSSNGHHSDEKETKGKAGCLERIDFGIDFQKYNVSHVADPRVSKGMSTAKEKGKAKVEPGNEVEPGLARIKFQKYNSKRTIREKVVYFLQYFRYLLDVFEKRKARGYDGDGRLDRKALAVLSPFRDLVNGEKAIYGLVPGVKLGALFHYRAEMTLIGLHRPNQAGIDFMSVNAQKYRDNAGLANCSIVRNNVSIAVSVVATDRPDHSEHDNYVRVHWINYEGQGEGPCDQKASGGNLALIHSCHLNLFVRVVRRYMDGRFFYDGLFDVKGYRYDVKKNSRPEFRVYKFRLRRRPLGVP